MNSYKEKYLKYKIKYLELKEQSAGTLTKCPLCDMYLDDKILLNHIHHIHNVHNNVHNNETSTQEDFAPLTPPMPPMEYSGPAIALPVKESTDILDFELTSIPLLLLFDSIKHLPIAYETHMMNCVYCGLEFNRYNLAKHLLSRHPMIINLEDLDFIKTIIPTEGPGNEVHKYIINKIQRKIEERDRQLQSFGSIGLDFNDFNTFPS